MPKILYDVIPGIWILAHCFRLAVAVVAKVDRMIIGRQAIDKARPKDLPAIVDALARWRQDPNRQVRESWPEAEPDHETDL